MFRPPKKKRVTYWKCSISSPALHNGWSIKQKGKTRIPSVSLHRSLILQKSQEWFRLLQILLSLVMFRPPKKKRGTYWKCSICSAVVYYGWSLKATFAKCKEMWWPGRYRWNRRNPSYHGFFLVPKANLRNKKEFRNRAEAWDELYPRCLSI